MSGDPADVGRTPVGIFILQVKDPFRSHHRAERITSRCVKHTFRFPRTSGGVENEQWMLGIEFDRIAVTGGVLHQFVPPVVAVGNHFDGSAGPPNTDDLLNAGRFF